MDIVKINQLIDLLKEYRDTRLVSLPESLEGDSLGDTRERTVVLAVGHSRANDGGAVSYDNKVNEWTYNLDLSFDIADALLDVPNLTTHIISNYKGDSYASAMEDLKDTTDPINADLVCELHFNSSTNEEANGFEALYWHNSTKGRKAAEGFVANMFTSFPTHRNRGAKAVPSITHRGGRFLQRLNAPCVILEPFFGSNQKEWEYFHDTKGRKQLARAIANSIKESVFFT